MDRERLTARGKNCSDRIEWIHRVLVALTVLAVDNRKKEDTSQHRLNESAIGKMDVRKRYENYRAGRSGNATKKDTRA